MKLAEQIPIFYREHLPKWLMQLDWQEIDKCNQCIMACGSSAVYKEDLKCCTYFPFVPNYQVGEILSQGGANKADLYQWISEKKFVLPIGLCAPEKYQSDYFHKGKTEFGNNPDLLCPFFKQGECSAWQYRTSECVGFQCYSSYGQQGLEFWKFLGELIHDLELYLSQEMMLAKGFLWPEVEGNLSYIKQDEFTGSEPKLSQLPDETWSDLWQHQLTRIDKYFIECYNEARQRDLSGYVENLESYQNLKRWKS